MLATNIITINTATIDPATFINAIVSLAQSSSSSINKPPNFYSVTF